MSWTDKFKSEWITKKITREAVDFADKFGKYLRDNFLSSSQLRNIFGEIKRIQMQLKSTPNLDEQKKYHTKFILLKPKLAYAAGRLRNKGLNEFKAVFDLAHDAVGELDENFPTRYKNFVDFIEAILAYHRAHGGR